MANYTLSTLPAKFVVGDTITIDYTGAMQSFNLSGYKELIALRFECWGGGGQHNGQAAPVGGGKGGYVSGELTIKQLQDVGISILYCLVGGYANVFNGGGSGSKVGGGATDVRTDWTGGVWNNATSLNSRILVAGGGGATTCVGHVAGDGGGFTGNAGVLGQNSYQAAGGGTQNAGGSGGSSSGGTDMTPRQGSAGTFGTGGTSFTTSFHGGGGGGGWYGGGGGVSDSNTAGVDCYNPGGGGSSFIAGHPSCPQPHPNGLVMTNGSTFAGANTMGANGKIVMTVLLANEAPISPSNLTPAGTVEVPSMQEILQPTISWSFNDPNSEDNQSAYQIVIKRNSDNFTVHDTGKVVSSSMSFVIPADKLVPSTLYSYSVRVWDKLDEASPTSSAQYFKTTDRPTATPTFGNVDPAAMLMGASPTPRLTWFYGDSDHHAQTQFEAEVFRASDNAKIHGSGLILSSDAFYDVPEGFLVPGETYYWRVRVIDSSGMDSGFSPSYFILINNPPRPLLIESPTDTYRTGNLPVFSATIGDDPENNNQHFKIEIAEDAGFTIGLQARTTETLQTGWEVKGASGDFEGMPAGGVDSTFESGNVRYTWQSDLEEGKTYYWRMAPIDVSTGAAGDWTAPRTIRCGNVLAFQGKTPVLTSLAAARIVFSAVLTLPTDGDVPASLKIEVCNNGLDTTPTWEDCTQAYARGQYHKFENTTKTADSWAVNYRVVINANDSLGAIEMDALGFNFD